jgi:hypothetical protein
VDGGCGSSLDSRLSKLNARNFSSELMLPTRLNFAGNGHGHDGSLDSGKANVRCIY